MKSLLAKYVLILLLLGNMPLTGKDIPRKESKLVYDVASFLSPNEETLLESKLRAYNDSTSTQIVV